MIYIIFANENGRMPFQDILEIRSAMLFSMMKT